jgi:hypothetical protein
MIGNLTVSSCVTFGLARAGRLERASEPNGSRAKMLLRVAGVLVVFLYGLDCFPCN